VAGVLRGLLDGRASAQDDQIGQGDLLAAGGLRPVEVLLDLFERVQDLAQLGRGVDLPVPLRRQADPCAVGAAALVRASEAGSRCPRRRDELGNRQPRLEDRALEGGDVVENESSL
jgi:hypothetical protein